MKVNSKVVSDKFDDEVVVVNLETGFYYSFKRTAMQIWSMLENEVSSTTIANSIDQLNEAQSSELNKFIAVLKEEQLISEDDDKSDHSNADKITYDDIEFAKFEDMSDLIMIDPIHDADEDKGWPNKAD